MTVWVRAAALADIPEDDVIGVSVNGRQLALYRIAEAIYATDDICTHGQARLSDGYFDPDSCSVECPLHAGIFDMVTGETLEGPVTIPLATYPVRCDGGDVMVELDGI